jgi:hypothetical protein
MELMALDKKAAKAKRASLTGIDRAGGPSGDVDGARVRETIVAAAVTAYSVIRS